MRNPFEAFLSEFNRIGSGPKQFASKATLESPKFQEYIKEAVKAYPRFLKGWFEQFKGFLFCKCNSLSKIETITQEFNPVTFCVYFQDPLISFATHPL